MKGPSPARFKRKPARGLSALPVAQGDRIVRARLLATVHTLPAVSRASCAGGKADYIPGMKLVLAILAYSMIGLVLGWGILLTVKGNPWLLIAGFLAYAVAFAKLGCLPRQSH